MDSIFKFMFFFILHQDMIQLAKSGHEGKWKTKQFLKEYIGTQEEPIALGQWPI